MHDRRIEGKVHTFGNQSVLYKNAMVWWDHETVSLWSQPWGMAILGLLEGTTLTLIPAEIVPWATWLDSNPDTTVLVDETAPSIIYSPQLPSEFMVIGVPIDDEANAYYFGSAAEEQVVNDVLAGLPIVLFVDPQTRSVNVYMRRPAANVGGAQVPSELTFEVLPDGVIRDRETLSTWDARRGFATGGPLTGTVIRPLPYVSAFDWAWRDFYPQSRFWGQPPGR